MSDELKDLEAALTFAAWSQKTGVGRQIADVWIASELDRTTRRIRERLPTFPADSREPHFEKSAPVAAVAG